MKKWEWDKRISTTEIYLNLGGVWLAWIPYCFTWSGELWWRGWWALRFDARREARFLGSIVLSFIASICSNVSTTSFIGGLFFCSCSIHCRASWATWNADLDGYFPSKRKSITLFSFLLSDKYGFIQSTSCSCPVGRFSSSARKPVNISINTTPKPYTSLLTYRCPVL